MCPPDMFVQVHAESGCSRSVLLEGVSFYTNQQISVLACDVLTSILLQLAEVIDLFWAPLSAMLVFQLYGNTLLSGVALLEELLPFTDIFPTATAGWFLQYTVIHMCPSVRPFAIPFTSSISLCFSASVSVGVSWWWRGLSLSYHPSRHRMCLTIATKESRCICLAFCIRLCSRFVLPSFILRASACILYTQRPLVYESLRGLLASK